MYKYLHCNVKTLTSSFQHNYLDWNTCKYRYNGRLNNLIQWDQIVLSSLVNSNLRGTLMKEMVVVKKYPTILSFISPRFSRIKLRTFIAPFHIDFSPTFFHSERAEKYSTGEHDESRNRDRSQEVQVNIVSNSGYQNTSLISPSLHTPTSKIKLFFFELETWQQFLLGDCPKGKKKTTQNWHLVPDAVINQMF